MSNSIFTYKTGKAFSSIAAQKAKISNKEKAAVDQFMKETDSVTMEQIFALIEKYGHPSEKNQVNEIKAKYTSGQGLEFDDVISLDLLYKSNCQHMSNKGDCDE